MIEMGRDLDQIRRKLRIEVRQTFSTLPAGPWHRDGITRWDFEDLPETAEVRRPGLIVRGFPPWSTPGRASRFGLRTRPPLRHRHRAGPAPALYAPGRQADRAACEEPAGHRRDVPELCDTRSRRCDLRRDLVGVIVDRALFDDDDSAGADDPHARPVHCPCRIRLAATGSRDQRSVHPRRHDPADPPGSIATTDRSFSADAGTAGC